MLIRCLFCNNVLDDSENFTAGEFVYCSKCDKDFEVVKIRPVRLKSLGSYEQHSEQLVEDDYYD